MVNVQFTSLHTNQNIKTPYYKLRPLTKWIVEKSSHFNLWTPTLLIYIFSVRY